MEHIGRFCGLQQPPCAVRRQREHNHLAAGVLEPQTNDKEERFNRFLKEDFLKWAIGGY
jgi:hypothetical protein